MGANGGILQVSLRETNLVTLVINGEEAGQDSRVGGEGEAVGACQCDGGYHAALNVDTVVGIERLGAHTAVTAINANAHTLVVVYGQKQVKVLLIGDALRCGTGHYRSPRAVVSIT